MLLHVAGLRIIWRSAWELAEAIAGPPAAGGTAETAQLEPALSAFCNPESACL